MILFVFALLCCGSSLRAQPHESWSDLDSPESRVYGSEKEEKYPVNAFFFEHESWEGHESWHAFWFLGARDYPYFSSFRILPFYYHLQSKKDNRERTLVLPPLYIHQVDDHTSFTFTPLSLFSDSNYGETYTHLYGWLFMRKKEQEMLHTAFFPLIYTGTGPDDFYAAAIPFFYYSKTGPPGNEATKLRTPLYYHSSKQGEDDGFFSISPLHFYDRDNAGTAIGFPVLPLLFYRNSSESSVTSRYATLLGVKTDSQGLEKLQILPLIYYGRNDYLWVLPVFFWGQDYHLVGPVWWSNNGEESKNFHVFPVFFSGTSVASSYSYSPLHFYSRTGDDTSWGFPLIPFLAYKGQTGDRVHRNVLTLFDWTTTAEGLERFWAMPLVYYGRDDYLWLLPFYFSGKDYHLVGPVYWSSGSDESKSFHVFPLYFSGTSAASSYSYSPLHFYSRTGDDTSWGFPVLPFLAYKGQNGDSVHRNVLTLFDWATTSKGLERFWAIPLVFYEPDKSLWVMPAFFKGENYLTVAPFYFHTEDPIEKTSTTFGPIYYWYNSPADNQRFIVNTYWSHNGASSSLHVMPVYFSWYTKPDPQGLGFESAVYNPLFVHKQDYTTDKDLSFSDTFWAPILPLYYRHRSVDADYNWALLFSWSTHLGELKHLAVAPFFFWKSGRKEGYLVVPPFFIRPSGPEAPEGWSAGLTHLHKWTESSDFLLWLLYYHDYTPEAQYTHIFPLYWSWHTQESTGQVTLPLWMDYEDKSKIVHVNILGYSKTRAAGVVGASVGAKDGRWYLDTEVSWLYNAFSFSARVSTPPPESAKKREQEPRVETLQSIGIRDIAEEEQKKQKEQKLDVPRLSRSLVTSRQDSYYFWGFSVLYGIVSYQQADSMRHFRLLPFYWFSWDTRSDNKVYVVPPFFVSYLSDETEYFVIFPIYGKQRQGKSWVKAWGAVLAIQEHDEDEKKDELSILWPLTNFYTSDKGSGSRIIPFYWHRSETQDGTTKERTVSLAYYRSAVTSKTQESFTMAPIVPLFFRWHTQDETTEKSTNILLPIFYFDRSQSIEMDPETHDPASSEVLLAALPGIYYHATKTPKFEESTLFLLGFYSHSDSEERHASVLFGLYSRDTYPQGGYYTKFLYGLAAAHESKEEKGSWIFPFYYYNGVVDSKNYTLNILGLIHRTVDDSEATFHIFPLIYTWKTPTEFTGFFAGFYVHSYEAEGRFNLLYLFDHTRNADYNEYEALFGAIHWNSSKDSSRASLLYGTIFEMDSDNGESRRTEVDLALYLAGFTVTPNSTHHRLLPLYWFSTDPDTTRLISPIVYYDDDRSDPSDHTRKIWSLPFWYSSEETGARKESSWFMPVPFLYHSSTVSASGATLASHTNLVLLEDWQTDERGLQSVFSLPFFSWKRDDHFWLIPYYHGENGGERSNHLWPLVFTWSSEKDFTGIFAGLYVRSYENYRRQNFLYLLDHTRSNDYGEYEAMFGAVHFSHSDELFKMRLLYGALFSLESHSGSSRQLDIDFALYLGGLQIRDDSIHHRLLPLYWYDHTQNSMLLASPLFYYRKDATSHTFVSLPWIEVESDSGASLMQLGLLGTAWYRNYDRYERSDRKMALLGILYDDVQRPERGYRARGSLWGLIWDYETEEETGFSKVSVLKFLYSRTELNGTVKHRILGVSF